VWGGVASFFALILSYATLLTIPSPYGGVLGIMLALVIFAEGAGLIIDWRGGRTEVVRVVRGPPETTSYVALYWGRTWFIGGVVGPALIIMGLFLIIGAVRSL
jgi:hypothetical protein